MSKSTIDPEGIFHPVEHAIICEWLDVSRPGIAVDVDIYAQVDGPEDGPVTLASDYSGQPGYYAVENAVARLVLAAVQQRLPQWSVHDGEKLVFARKYTKKPARKVDLLPRLLFSINWADSGPGYSWPVAYYVAWLPVYDIYIVTESADSPDAHGYCDRALGWFSPGVSVERGARKAITADWYNQHLEGCQARWQDFLQEGLIPNAAASDWADEVWGEEEEYETWEAV